MLIHGTEHYKNTQIATLETLLQIILVANVAGNVILI